MAKIGVSQLDRNLIVTLSSIIKKRLHDTYGFIPNNVQEVQDGIDDNTMMELNNEVVVYYDGLFDDEQVQVNIEKKEYATLLN